METFLRWQLVTFLLIAFHGLLESLCRLQVLFGSAYSTEIM